MTREVSSGHHGGPFRALLSACVYSQLRRRRGKSQKAGTRGLRPTAPSHCTLARPSAHSQRPFRDFGATSSMVGRGPWVSMWTHDNWVAPRGRDRSRMDAEKKEAAGIPTVGAVHTDRQCVKGW